MEQERPGDVSGQQAATRDDLFSLTALPFERLTLPTGKVVTVQGMSGTDRDAFEASMMKDRRGRRNLDNVRARLAVRCLYDAPGGARLFQASDVERLGKIRVDVLQKIFEVAQQLSGMSDEDIDQMGKGSEDEAGAGSSSS